MSTEVWVAIIINATGLIALWLQLYYQGSSIRKIQHQTNAMHDRIVRQAEKVARQEGGDAERARQAAEDKAESGG